MGMTSPKRPSKHTREGTGKTNTRRGTYVPSKVKSIDTNNDLLNPSNPVSPLNPLNPLSPFSIL